MSEVRKSHYPHILSGTEIVCGGTDERLPSLGRLLVAISKYEMPHVRIDIYARGVDTHGLVRGIHPIEQEIIPVADDLEVVHKFGPESIWPYFERAFERNARTMNVARSIVPFRFNGRPVENIINVEIFGPDY
jgi:hypothetical protein